METFIGWVIGLFVGGIGLLMLIGFFAALFDDTGMDDRVERNRSRGLGKVLLTGILLGMWLDDDE